MTIWPHRPLVPRRREIVNLGNYTIRYISIVDYSLMRCSEWDVGDTGVISPGISAMYRAYDTRRDITLQRRNGAPEHNYGATISGPKRPRTTTPSYPTTSMLLWFYEISAEPARQPHIHGLPATSALTATGTYADKPHECRRTGKCQQHHHVTFTRHYHHVYHAMPLPVLSLGCYYTAVEFLYAHLLDNSITSNATTMKY
jgi:hypothetical protein